MLSTIRKVVDLFEGREKLRLAGLFGAILATGMVEAVGVASIMPFMALVGNPNIVSGGGRLGKLYTALHFTSVHRYLIAVGAAVLFLMFLSNALGAFTTWATLRIVWRKNHTLSQRLLRKYLSQPYSYFLNCNTADLSTNVLGEVNSVTVGTLVPLLNAVSKLIVALFLIGLLLVVDVRIAASVAVVLGGAYGAIYVSARRTQARIGRERLHANTLRYKTAAEAFGGIKELKVMGREEHFLKRFRAPSALFSRHMASNQIVATLPRYIMEPVALGGALLIVLLALVGNRDVGHVLPIVSVYAFAGYRLMPALQQVFGGVTSVRFNQPALDTLYADLMDSGVNPARRCGPMRTRRLRWRSSTRWRSTR